MGLASVHISGEFWQEIMTEGWSNIDDGAVVKCVKGLPEGAVCKSVFYRQWPAMSDFAPTPELVFVFEHPDFDEVSPGDPIPPIRVVYRKIRDGE